MRDVTMEEQGKREKRERKRREGTEEVRKGPGRIVLERGQERSKGEEEGVRKEVGRGGG